MRFKASAFLCLALVLFGNAIRAQDKAATDEEKMQDAWSNFVFEEVILRRSDDPMLKSPLALPQPKLTLEATDDGKTDVKARVGLAVKKKVMLDLVVTSPRNSSGETTLATLGGLSNGSTAEASFSWLPWSLPNIKYREARNKMDPAMANEDPKAKEEAEAWLRSYGQPSMSRPSAVAALGGLERYNAAVDACQTLLRSSIIPILTVSAKAGQQDFHFVNASTLASGDESHTGHQFTGSLGGYVRGTTYLALSYDHGTAFAAGRTANLCSPFGSTSSLECRNVVIGRPAKQTTEGLEFEIRHLSGSLGLSAHVVRDLQNDVTFVEVPIYFLQKAGSSGMELNGGVAIQWRSDTRTFSLSAFIGPALSTVVRMFESKGSS